MFIQDYLLPAVQLVKSHQKVILHTFVFMILGLVLAIIGTLVSAVPLVAALTYSAVSITGITLGTLQTTIMGSNTIIAGAAVSVLLFLLNLLIWKSFFIGGVIRSVADPQDTVGAAIKLAFGGIVPTIKPLIFIWIILLLISGIFGGGYWYTKNMMTGMGIVPEVLAVLGILFNLIFLLMVGLSPFASNIDAVGVIESVKRSKRAVMADFLNFIGLAIVLGLVNAIVVPIPGFDVIVSWILIPINAAAFAGYYYLNQGGQKPGEKPSSNAPAPTSEPRPVEPKAEPAEEKSRFETDDQRTKRILNKILKEI